MSKYELTWITEHLAAGHAPFSHDDLAEMRWQGIDAIVNLCGEYCDLHEIQQDSGFEVYYLPIADECAPDMAEMEKAIEWVDEIIDQGKKVLVHCRFGIGRVSCALALVFGVFSRRQLRRAPFLGSTGS